MRLGHAPHLKVLFVFATLLAVLTAAEACLASSALMISPQRVIFEGRERSRTLYLMNPSTETRTYRVSLKMYRQADDGTAIPVTGELNENEKMAMKMFRFSPRQFTIQGHSRQTVKVLVQRPKDLPPGEYRAHVSFKPVKGGVTPPSEKELSEQSHGISLTMEFTVSIAVIYRFKAGDPILDFNTAKYTHFEVDPNRPYLAVGVTRKGLRSVLTELTAFYKATPNAKPVELGINQGQTIYVPNADRTIYIPLDVGDINLDTGFIEVVAKDVEKSLDPRLSRANAPVINRHTFALPLPGSWR